MSAHAIGLATLSLGLSCRPERYRMLLPACLAILALALLLSVPALNQSFFLLLNQAAVVLPASFWAHVTALGDAQIAIALLMPFALRHRAAALAALLACLFAGLGVHLLKLALAMPRPAAVLDPALFEVIGPRLHGRSFPSGHAVTAFVFLALLAGHTLPRHWLWLGGGLAALIALSRIAVGAHWPTDVLAGAVLGWLAGFAALYAARRFSPAWQRRLGALAIFLFLLTTLWLLTGFDSGYAAARWLEQAIALVALLLSARIVLARWPGRAFHVSPRFHRHSPLQRDR